MAGIKVPAVNMSIRASVLLRTYTRGTMGATATSTVAQLGPPVALGTRDRSWWPGRRRSRAIAHTTRALVAIVISPQQNIETQMKNRKTFSMLGPRTSSRMNASGAGSAVVAATSLVATAAAMRKIMPRTPAATTARIMALG